MKILHDYLSYILSKQWCKPANRQFYEVKNPSNGETLTKTMQASLELTCSYIQSPPRLFLSLLTVY